MPKLWTEVDGEKWLDNPRRRRRRKAGARRRAGSKRSKARRSPPAGFASWRAYMAHIRGMKKGGRGMARRKRGARRHRARHNPPGRRHARRRFRRNIPAFARGWMSTAVTGLKGGAGVVLGKAVGRSVPAIIKQDKNSLIGIAIQLAVGVFVAPFVSKFAGPVVGNGFLYGTFASPIESQVLKMNLPVISPALSSYADEMNAIPVVRSLAAPAGMPGFTIDEEEQMLVQ